MPKTPPATALREIAQQLQAMIDGGDFALCFAHVRADMALLPDRLAELANEIEAPPKGVRKTQLEFGPSGGAGPDA
jgi:hypothetical protein